MPRLEKTKRNNRIYTLSKRGGGKLSVRQLQKKFEFKSAKTIFAILERVDRRKEAKK